MCSVECGQNLLTPLNMRRSFLSDFDDPDDDKVTLFLIIINNNKYRLIFFYMETG